MVHSSSSCPPKYFFFYEFNLDLRTKSNPFSLRPTFKYIIRTRFVSMWDSIRWVPWFLWQEMLSTLKRLDNFYIDPSICLWGSYRIDATRWSHTDTASGLNIRRYTHRSLFHSDATSRQDTILLSLLPSSWPLDPLDPTDKPLSHTATRPSISLPETSRRIVSCPLCWVLIPVHDTWLPVEINEKI